MMAVPLDHSPEEPAAGNGRDAARLRGRRAPMRYRIAPGPDCLWAELSHCENVAEMRAFLRVVARCSARCPVVLVRVRESKPLFHVERGGLLECLLAIARVPQHRLALVADTPDLQASHEYLEVIARQRGVRVRSFRNEAGALLWLKDRRAQLERRRDEHAVPGAGAERRSGVERRRLLAAS
jgi:hypothetical protein